MSQITLTWNSIPAVDTAITITDSYTGRNMLETFKTLRAVALESTAGTTILDSRQNFIQAFNSDHNNTILYTVLLGLTVDTVIIGGINPNSSFTVLSNTTAGAITTNAFNDAPTPPFTIEEVVVAEATTLPCDNVKLTISTSDTSDSISSPISEAVTVNPHVIEVPRSEQIKIIMNLGVDDASVKYRIPKLLSTYFNVDILNTPAGATINVQKLYPLSTSGLPGVIYPLTFQYSMDGIVWQNGSSWSGLVADTYTMYVKDNIGCEINFPFTVDAFTPNLVDYDGIAEISNANSIRYKENVVWTDELRKTPENTLSFEEETKINRRNFIDWWITTDIKPTQVRTNYDTVTSVLVDCDAVETALTVTKVTDNMDKTDVRDIHTFNFTSGQYNGYLGIYFGAGNTYDPITLVQDGSYNLGKSTPNFVNIGDYINLEAQGWFRITDIVTNQEVSTGVFQTVVVLGASNADYSYTNGDTLKGTSIYNIVDFERYEYTVDASTLDGFYYVKTNITDAVFEDKEWISEWLNVKTEQPCHHLIKWYGSENNEINYATGIVNSLRIPYVLPLTLIPNEEQDIYVTDTQTIALENKYRRFWKFSPMPLPTMMIDKLELIFSHDRISIDGKTYLKEGETEVNSLGSTNLYLLTVNLVQSDYVFDSNRGIGNEEITIPQVILLDVNAGETGFLIVE